ncbi:MAG TPA: SPOR domain-containing protein [Burkholderiales bacterium]|nr:SPOR domain-containing protein [Burkholderiales bacterium]
MAATGQYKLLDERLEATRVLLGSMSSERFTVHLFYTQDHGPDRIEAFLQRAAKSVDISLVFVLASRGAGKTKYRVFYGSYPSRDEAAAAMASLPAEFHKDFRLQLTTLEQARRAG